MQTIHRIERKRKNFTPLDNTVLRCKNLSFSARGILAYMLSHTGEWDMNMGDLEKQTTDARRIVRKAIWELEAAGYATRHQIKNAMNQFTGTVWTWHEEPVSVGERTTKPSGVGRLTDSGGSGNRLTGNGPLGNHGGYKKTMIEEKHGEERFGGEEKDRKGFNPKTGEYEWS